MYSRYGYGMGYSQVITVVACKFWNYFLAHGSTKQENQMKMNTLELKKLLYRRKNCLRRLHFDFKYLIYVFLHILPFNLTYISSMRRNANLRISHPIAKVSLWIFINARFRCCCVFLLCAIFFNHTSQRIFTNL